MTETYRGTSPVLTNFSIDLDKKESTDYAVTNPEEKYTAPVKN